VGNFPGCNEMPGETFVTQELEGRKKPRWQRFQTGEAE
jgi:hypothetical protein